MKLTLSSKAEREVDRAIKEIAADSRLAALRRLCGMRGVPVPELQWKVIVAEPNWATKPLPVEPRPQPKPRKRIVDPKAIREYVRTHPDCEVDGCNNIPCPEPHHLISRKSPRKGDDVPENLLRLCKRHHVEWHTWGGKRWLARYESQLTAAARAKVRAALRLS